MSKKQGSDAQTVRNTIHRGSTILLMGPTGSGKSAFVNHLTKDENANGGHDLQHQVKTSEYVDPHSGISVRLVDTPAFDDTHSNVSDTDVLAAIAGFLKEDDTKVNGILYFHRISDHRMGGPVKKNLKIFKELCGDDNFRHVRIITTYWNLVDDKDGKSREAALSNGPFKALVKGGSKFVRHDQLVESARSIINEFIHHDPFKLKIQKELEASQTLGETSAGAVILEEIQATQDKVEKEAEAVRKEMVDSVYKGDDEKLMDKNSQRLEEAVARIQEERRKLETLRIGQEQERASPEKTHKKDTKNHQSKRAEKQKKETKKSEGHSISFPGPGLDEEIRQQQQQQTSRRQPSSSAHMRGEVRSLFRDMADVVRHCSQAGADQFGGLGKLFGALVGLAVVNGVAVGVLFGLWFSLVVAAKRVVLGGGK